MIPEVGSGLRLPLLRQDVHLGDDEVEAQVPQQSLQLGDQRRDLVIRHVPSLGRAERD
ncbi:hypothetical protein JNUCC0626_48345 [Lentzea sp. JNUCC 0626]|uniref:hypothetical protein n=1 Tax=Lentzea sp. JNUCC 0626 TaxID=3367513 RepID=UPI003747F257